MFIWLNRLMNNCDCLLVITVQVYMIWCILFFIRDRYGQSDVFHLYFQWMQLLKKSSYPFVMTVKDNDSCAIIWLKLLSGTFLGYLFSLYYCAEYEHLEKSPNPYNAVSIFNVHCTRQENEIYFEYLFMINWNDCYNFIR